MTMTNKKDFTPPEKLINGHTHLKKLDEFLKNKLTPDDFEIAHEFLKNEAYDIFNQTLDNINIGVEMTLLEIKDYIINIFKGKEEINFDEREVSTIKENLLKLLILYELPNIAKSKNFNSYEIPKEIKEYYLALYTFKEITGFNLNITKEFIKIIKEFIPCN